MRMQNTNPLFRRCDSLREVMFRDKGEARSLAWADWLDSYYLGTNEKRRAMLDERPELEGSVWDALLGASIEYLAHLARLEPPYWCYEAERRWETFYWGGHTLPAMKKLMFLESPAEFRTRNLFVGRGFIERAKMPDRWRAKPPKWQREWMESHERATVPGGV